MTEPRRRSEPCFYVHLKPASTATPGAPTPQTKGVKDASVAYKAALDHFAAMEKAVGAEETSGTAALNAYANAKHQLSAIKRVYDNEVAKARKTLQPAQQPIPPVVQDISKHVVSFEYEEDEKKADILKLTVDNRDLAYFDSPLFEKGTSLIVSWGYVGAMAPPREVIVQKVTGSTSLVVEAHAKSVLMHKLTRVRSFDNKTRSEIVKQVAAENGYIGPEVQDIEETTTRHGVISQTAQTDAQFLKKLADVEGFEFYVDFDGLHWHRRRFEQKPIRVLTYYLPPGVGDIKSFSVENDVTAKPAKVTAKGRDPIAKKDIAQTADNASTKRSTLAPVIEIVDPRTGLTTFKTKEASAQEVVTTATSDKDAKKEADARFTRTQQTAVTLSMELVGDANLVSKTIVEIRGIGKRLSGKYYIGALKHKLDASGYDMSAKSKTDGTQAGAAKSKGQANTKPADAAKDGADSGKLTPIKVVDPRDGVSRIIYKDTRGRDAAEKT